MQVISNYALARHSNDFFFPYIYSINAGDGAFILIAIILRRVVVLPSLSIHLYDLSLINSFLTRLPALVSSRSHDKTSLTSSTMCSACYSSYCWNRSCLVVPLKPKTLFTINDTPPMMFQSLPSCAHPPIIAIDIVDVEFTVIPESSLLLVILPREKSIILI